MNRKKVIFIVVFVLAIIGSAFAYIQLLKTQTHPLNIVTNGTTEYTIVYDTTSAADSFAVKEFTDIVRETTGCEINILCVSDTESNKLKKRVLVGKNKLTIDILGNDFLNKLKDQESIVTSKGDDLILVGGGNWGTIYAVYDFLEDYLGYRNFGPWVGGERFIKTNNLIFPGKTTRKRPAFYGFRDEYTMYSYPDKAAASKFYIRNRGNRNIGRGGAHSHVKTSGGAEALNKLESPYRSLIPGHGFEFFVSAYDKKSPLDGEIIEGMFNTHPEYFTQTPDGKRVPNLQLCLSNKDLRVLLTQRIIEKIIQKGNGVYMVGANDFPGALCHCKQCKELAVNYKSDGGPLYDYLIELCNHIKEEYPDVYITTLAYRKNQTEVPPQVHQLPSNFIIDFAPVDDNWAVSLKEQKNGTYNNLIKWREITTHVSYWFYTSVRAPYGIYRRTQEDLKTVHEAGVNSVGLCGGPSPCVAGLVTYVFFRLLLDPYQNVEKLVEEFCEHEFGSAAPLMIEYFKELEDFREATKDAAYVTCDSSYSSIPVTPSLVVKCQLLFEKMLVLVDDDVSKMENVQCARFGLDIWTLMLFAKISKEFPDSKIDPDLVVKRLEGTREIMKRNHRRRSRPAEQQIGVQALNSKIKNYALPEPINKYPPHLVVRQLPNSPTDKYAIDTDAVADKAAVTTFPAGSIDKRGAYTCLYDWEDKSTQSNAKYIPLRDIVPNRYHLYNLGNGNLYRKCSLVLSNNWLLNIDLSPHYNHTFPDKNFDIWASLKFKGPDFDSESVDTVNSIFCDQVFLIEHKD